MVRAQVAPLSVKHLAILGLRFSKTALAGEGDGEALHKAKRLWILRPFPAATDRDQLAFQLLYLRVVRLS